MGLCSSVPGGKGKKGKAARAQEQSEQDGADPRGSVDGEKLLMQRSRTGHLMNAGNGRGSLVVQAIRNSDASDLTTSVCVADAADVLFCDAQRSEGSRPDSADANEVAVADNSFDVSGDRFFHPGMHRHVSKSSAGSHRGSGVDVEAVLHEIERIVDQEYDILLAELLLEEVVKKLSSEHLDQVLASPVIDRMKRKLDYLRTVGKACCRSDDGWFNVYKDGPQSIDGLIDKADPSVLHYKARITIPAKLTTVMAVANEVDLMPTWNRLVVGTPEVIGRRTAHYMVLHYQMSMLGGMYKVDLLNEVRRFSDTRGGFVAEYIHSADSGHPCYTEPGSGFKRPTTEVKNVWVACGDSSTVLIQVGKLKLPFSATRWLASSIGGLAGRFIVGGLIANSLRASEESNPWEARVQADESGLYRRLSELETSRGSVGRTPQQGSSVPSFRNADLEPYFERGQVLRALQAAPDVDIAVTREAKEIWV